MILSTQPINNDGIGFVESYDFSTANLDHTSRVHAVTYVASICYGNPKAVDSESLFNRLAAEAAGLPSSSYEFVPVLLSASTFDSLILTYHMLKYGEWVEDGKYLLTNLRALIADVGDDHINYYNTPEECAIIARHFKVFKFKVDIATRTQMIRHRVSWQELSRRYVSGKRQAFEFYISPRLAALSQAGTPRFITSDFVNIAVDMYNYAIDNGVKPEEARRLLPQSMYTTIWGAFQPSQLANFFSLRLDPHSQAEIREVAQAMQSLIGAPNETTE